MTGRATAPQDWKTEYKMSNETDDETVLLNQNNDEILSDGGPPNLEWAAKLQKESALAAELTSETFESKPREEQAATLQSWWWIVSEILGDHATEKYGERVHHARKPADMLMRMKAFTREIAYGRDPDLSKDARRRGNLPTYGERRDRAIAGAYVRAVRDGKIEDHHPSQTVLDLFGMADTRPISKWGADEKLRVEFPIYDEHSGNSLSKLLKEAGKRYQKYGPTQSAIIKRAKGDSN